MYTVHSIWTVNNYNTTLTYSKPMWPESFHNRSSKRIVTFACRKIYMYIYISIISGKYRSLFLTKKTLTYIASWSKTTCSPKIIYFL